MANIYRINQLPIYLAWSNARTRCNNPKYRDYHRYGGRGIQMCKEWGRFDEFFKDMYPTYVDGLTLDRIDNNKGYSKENCRWVTRKEQANNTQRNHLFEFNGVKKTLIAWSEQLNIKWSTLSQRIYVYKWSIEKSLTTQVSLERRDNHS